ncbi:MAG: TonB-dependent receptor [Candidatus Cyclobacteriaceae bacterium M3_2C_046]
MNYLDSDTKGLKLKSLLGCLIFLGFVWHNLSAQTMVKGKVCQKNGTPLPYVNIYLLNDPLVGTVTDSQGDFQFSLGLPDTLVASCLGYKPQQIPLTENASSVRIYLQEVVNEMSELVIKSDRLIAEGFEQKKIQKLDIYQNPAAKADPLLAINTLPFATNLDESASVRIRGSLPHEVGIFLNGAPVYDAVRYGQINGIGTFSIFNTGMIDQIHVFPGLAPVEYGSQTAGLVSIQTESKIPSIPQTELLVSLANLGLSHTSSIGKTGVRLFSNYQPAGLFKQLNAKALEGIQDFNSVDGGLQLISQPGPKLQLKFFNYFNQENYLYDFSQAGRKMTLNQAKKRNLAILNLKQTWDAMNFQINTGYSWSRQVFGFLQSQTGIGRHNLFTSLNLHGSAQDQEWKSGLLADYQVLDFDQLTYRYPYALGEGFPLDSIVELTSIFNLEGYFFYKKTFFRQLKAGVGINFNQQLQGNFNFMLNYDFSDHSSLNFTAGRAIRTYLPDQFFNQTYQVNSLQSSLEWAHKSEFLDLSIASYFHQKQYEDELVSALGVEVYQAWNWPKWSLNWSFSSLKYLQSVQNNQALKLMLSDINYFLRGAATYRPWPDFSWQANLVYRQGALFYPVTSAQWDQNLEVYYPVLAVQPQVLPDYFILNTAMNKNFLLFGQWPVVFFVSINNLFNHKNIRDFAYGTRYETTHPVYFSLRTYYLGFNLNL